VRPPPVLFPLELLPDRWQAWVERSAHVFTPVDYVAQGLLAAVSAVCSGGIEVRVTAQWSEPLVLWQAMVGAASSGKTPALAAVRRLVDGLAPDDEPEPEPESDSAAEPASPDSSTGMDPLFARMLVRRPCITLWRDELTSSLGQASRDYDRAEWLASWDGAQVCADAPDRWDIEEDRPLRNILGGLAPDQLGEVFGETGNALAARFLYAWPEPPTRPALSDETADDEGVRAMLRRIWSLAGEVAYPGQLDLEADAMVRLGQLLPGVRQRARAAEGAEAAWLGKGAGMIVRLAGLLTLMYWAQDSEDKVPQVGITAPLLEKAHALWADYFCPHAESVFQRAGWGDHDATARRAARWLRRARLHQVSRENIRCDALCQTVNAEGADQVIERLEAGGVLRPVSKQTTGGRPKLRWEVNPSLR